MLSSEDIKQQTENALNQWGEQWTRHAEENSVHEMKPFADFQNTGIGKAVLCVANGASFEENIDTIKEHQHKVDILCCDKTLGHLLDNGITPTFCMVCDANVDYDKFMKRWEGKLSDTILFINACGNPLWAKNGNWKDIYFFINKDIMNSEKKFIKISGCNNVIPAGTNVSNAMVILLTQCDNEVKRNFFAYDKILLIGYDYSWKEDAYYSFNKTGSGKQNYMRHVYGLNSAGENCFTSNNLLFSMQWIDLYIRNFSLPVVQCTKNTILQLKHMGKLEEQMNYAFNQGHSNIVRKMVAMRKKILTELQGIDGQLNQIGKDHTYSFLSSI